MWWGAVAQGERREAEERAIRSRRILFKCGSIQLVVEWVGKPGKKLGSPWLALAIIAFLMRAIFPLLILVSITLVFLLLFEVAVLRPLGYEDLIINLLMSAAEPIWRYIPAIVFILLILSAMGEILSRILNQILGDSNQPQR